MRTFLLLFIASTGCTFAAPDGELEPEPTDDEGPTTPPPVLATCVPSDPALRLCVDFDGSIVDRSAGAAAITVNAVDSMDRDGEPAAVLTATSTIHLREATKLEIAQGLSLDMWIRPSGTPGAEGYWLLDNNQQYGATYTSAGTIRCVLGSRSVESAATIMDDGQFHHVACTYDGTDLKVFVDGELSRCQATTAGIPTSGTSGLAIGANLTGADTAPSFSGKFVGGIDDVRVWARAGLDACTAAGKSGCKTRCDQL